VRDRVVAVEEQFERIDPKIDRILVQMEQHWQPSIVPDLDPADTHFTPPLPSSSPIPGNPPVRASLNLTVTGWATPPVGRTTPPDCLLKTLRGEPCSEGTTPRSPAPVKALKLTPPDHAARPDCLLKTLKGELC
jgi:hypothetical protein